MTTIGVNRLRYSREVETAPSRFLDVAGYGLWTLRADAWAEVNA